MKTWLAPQVHPRANDSGGRLHGEVAAHTKGLTATLMCGYASRAMRKPLTALLCVVLLAGCGDDDTPDLTCAGIGKFESCNFDFYDGFPFEYRPDIICFRTCRDDGDGDWVGRWSDCTCREQGTCSQGFHDVTDINPDGGCPNDPDGAWTPPECLGSIDCPNQDPLNKCASPVCNNGTCAIEAVPEGTIMAEQTPFDCAISVCDGKGNTSTIYDPSDLPFIAPGDCLTWTCDDLSESLVATFYPYQPASDGLQCTTDVCTLMGTAHEPVTGLPCNEQGGAICLDGSCVPFIPVKCVITVTSQVYEGCDGLEHPGVTIEWGGSTPGVCTENGADVGYCPPGESCAVTENGGPPQPGTCL